MSLDYVSLAATATALIKSAGQTLNLKRVAAGETYSPITGVATPAGSPGLTPFNGVLLNVDDKYAATVGQENVQMRDQLCYMEPSVIVPLMTDKVVVGSEDWQVVNIVTINPAGTPLLYILQARP